MATKLDGDVPAPREEHPNTPSQPLFKDYALRPAPRLNYEAFE